MCEILHYHIAASVLRLLHRTRVLDYDSGRCGILQTRSMGIPLMAYSIHIHTHTHTYIYIYIFPHFDYFSTYLGGNEFNMLNMSDCVDGDPF